MSLLHDLEELHLSLSAIVTKSQLMDLSDLTYLLRMAMLEIMEKQQAEMDRIEQGNFCQGTAGLAGERPPSAY
ncbi:MAG: hypothetical protein U0987_15560 [Afipia sp.]|jgi:hypothetical protein|nr:hypothetical protein [Afipia sp.]